MNAVKEKLQFERVLQASPGEIYYAFTHATAWQRWYGDLAHVDPNPGGCLYVCMGGSCVVGEYTALEENQRIAFTWCGTGEPKTAMDVSLAEDGAGTRMTLAVVPSDPSDPLWTEKAPAIEATWQRTLEELVALLETGYGVQNRPLLGVMGGQDLDKDAVERLGVPVERGFLIFEPVEGLGAQAAGLQKDDVVVELAGQPVLDGTSLGTALLEHRPGDRVDVVFYRGAGRHVVPLVLSERPRPETPSTAQALAEALHDIYAHHEQAFTEVLSGLPESHLSWAPDEVRWSAKHVLAHLLTSEQGMHLWLARLMAGLDTTNWATHDELWVRAVADSYPDTPSLLAALKRAYAVTVRLAGTLPDEFLVQKLLYVQVASAMTDGMAYHTRLHLDQMRKVLAEVPA